ncbi:putative defense protein Hdd11 [Macrosteles quadrilineatus]|uniref:putative defense protein Hdd11 n=1 Tax=Macrosteles quadrilineatus TaxID=74068 RepID=UPI0023E1FDE0|nr:putative defense protein Hdd11 [Macrosteles quadrilineatus]
MTPATNSIASFLLLASVFQNTHGYSDGAPEEVCETLIPRHLKPPQNTTSPYRIELSTYEMSSNHIKYNPIGGNQMMNLTLTGHQAFKGFIIQARMNDRVVGRFEPTPKYYQMLDCCDGVENTATHIENDVKSEVVFKWVPPTKVAGKVWFYASVVRNFDIYWIDITSDPLELTMPDANK